MNAVLEKSKPLTAEEDNARLRAFLQVFADCKGDNTLSEAFARRIRYIARRALAGDAHNG